MKAAFALALLSLGAMGSFAVNAQDGSFMSRGAGTTSCGTYIAWRNSGNAPNVSQVVQWTWGYLHGYNTYTLSAKIDPPENDAVAAYLEKYCRDNPLGYVIYAIPKLIDELGGAGAAPVRKK